MRILLAATMAASVLAIGASTVPAASLPPADEAGNPAAVHKVQQTLPSPGTEGSKMRPEQGGKRGNGNGSRMGQQPRGYINGGRERRGEREWRGDRGEWRGYRGDRGEWRGRGNGDWRRGRRDFEGRGGFGYRAGCGWLRRRALETGSRYWWRQYRDCID
jgi:hypothetical protein